MRFPWSQPQSSGLPMPSFLNRLFRRPDKLAGVKVPAPTPPAEKPNPVAIPVPEGMPTELLQRVPTRQPRDPSRKGKRRTKKEIAADDKAWVEGMLHQARVRFDGHRRHPLSLALGR